MIRVPVFHRLGKVENCMGDGIPLERIRRQCMQDTTRLFSHVRDLRQDPLHFRFQSSHGVGSIKALTGIVAEIRGRLPE